MGYNRDAAEAYAKKYWNRPCDDGLIMLKNGMVNVEERRKSLNAPAEKGWVPIFAPDATKAFEDAVFRKTDGTEADKLIQGWDGMVDCAHYLSRCVQAGGINVFAVDVGKLVGDLQARSDTKTLASKVSQARCQKIIDTGIFKPGDMIGYFPLDGGSYSHSAMYVGKPAPGDPGRITCHSRSRYKVDLTGFEAFWYINDNGFKFTLIHFSSDDAPPSPATAEKLQGWWKVEYGARTEYYYVFKDGRARYTNRPPVRKDAPLHPLEGSAYWFEELNKITFIWRNTGTVEVWTQNGAAGQFNIKVNEMSGKASRIT